MRHSTRLTSSLAALFIATASFSSSAFADSSAALGALGQIAGAMYGSQASTTTSASLPVTLYTTAQMNAMSCLDLELAANKLNRAIERSKANATDLLEQEKAQNNDPTAQQQRQYSAIAGLIGGVMAQRGGKAAQYAQIAQQIGNNGTATSRTLDTEIDNLTKMNDQAADMAVIRRHKNCSAQTTAATATTAAAAGAVATTATQVTTRPANANSTPATVTHSSTNTTGTSKSVTTTSRDANGNLVTTTTTTTVAGAPAATTEVTTTKSVKAKKAKKAKKSKKAKK